MKKAKLAALISLSLANIAGLCLVTFAWFTARQRVENGMNNIVAVDTKFVDHVNFYKYYFEEGMAPQKGIYTFEKVRSDDPDMGKYSIIGSDYQLLIEIYLSGPAVTGNFDLIAKTEADSYLGEVGDDGINPKTLLKKSGNSLSSVVCFYDFLETELQDQGDYYKVDINGKSKTNFVTKEDGLNVLNKEAVSIGEYTALNKIYLVLDYDISLIEEIYSLNLGNEAIGGMAGVDDEMSYIDYDVDFHFEVRGRD